METSKSKNKIKVFKLKSLKKKRTKECKEDNAESQHEDLIERLSFDDNVPSTQNRNRAYAIIRSIKQKLKFRRNKMSVKSEKKLSIRSDVLLQNNLSSNNSPESDNDDSMIPYILTEPPPAVPPRNLKETYLGQYVKIPRRIISNRGQNSSPGGNSSASELSAAADGDASDSSSSDSIYHLQSRFFPSLSDTLTCLAKYGWYWGPITRTEAEEKLLNQPDGAFLVRDSSSDNYLFSLSFRCWGRVMHSRIEYKYGNYAIMNQQGFYSIDDLIKKAMATSKNGIYCYSRSRGDIEPAYPVRLTKPISRFTQVRSLQYLCRFVIRQYISINNIQKLPLPVSLQVYLQQGHF